MFVAVMNNFSIGRRNKREADLGHFCYGSNLLPEQRKRGIRVFSSICNANVMGLFCCYWHVAEKAPDQGSKKPSNVLAVLQGR